MRQTPETCADKEFYQRLYPSSSFEEARAVLIGRYLERELAPEMRNQLKVHLDQCSCCTQFLSELEKIGEFKATRDPVPYASCPSSESMDVYLFDRTALPDRDAETIHTHIAECPLCSEEIEWLRSVERGKIIEYNQSAQGTRHSGRKDVFSQLTVAAAVFFLVLSAFFWWQNTHATLPAAELKALAHVKEPNEINFVSLTQSAAPLDSANEKNYEEGVNLFKRGDFRSAGSLFEDVLSKNPNHSASLFLLGYCYYKLHEMDKAFALCDRAERVHPHSLERCMSLVHMALMTGHYGRAVEEINALYHQAPEVPEVDQMYHEIMRLTQGRMVKM